MDADGSKSLDIQEVDVLFRRMRLFLSFRMLWSLILEVDENCNGQIEVEEFLVMVAKLRGQEPLSSEFYLRSLPRALNERGREVFAALARKEDGMLSREGVIAALRQINVKTSTEGDKFKKALTEAIAETSGGGQSVDMQRFLVLVGKLRKQAPEIDVALMSLTVEERERYTIAYRDWMSVVMSERPVKSRRVPKGLVTPIDIVAVVTKLGFQSSEQQVSHILETMAPEGSNAPPGAPQRLELREFLFILVSLGAGCGVNSRPLIGPGATYQEAFEVGASLRDMFELGYDSLVEIRKAGWGAQSLFNAGLANLKELRQVGYTVPEMRKMGCTAIQLKLAGFSMEELRNGGFSACVLQEAAKSLSNQRVDQKKPAGDIIGIKLLPLAEKETGGHFAFRPEERWWGTPRIHALLGSSGPGSGSGKSLKTDSLQKTASKASLLAGAQLLLA
eukprot:gnl/TRDRNA2_/TRDRNA2_172238_c2_seq13.p1 gnl/TRDRNA2_/TRDRNA2_172238_c2~~gnl/TRDRNA2_/TRDRNA2_172238_c2_seq13.p1  ORF type:complete len:487 (-),score=68.37 gnl/TRDRNA2_/TRDRNA2_172238_c2_seq13:631-1974(-)